MLSIFEKDLIKAMKDKNKAKIIALRNIIGKLKTEKIDKGRDLKQSEYTKTLKTTIKQLKESISQYKLVNRHDLINKESYELNVIKGYLPPELTESETRALIKGYIKSISANKPTDFGRVMSLLMKKQTNNIDGQIAKKIIEQELCK
tara:strand:- start:1738 stop:2178 length:441 start_codon:yes stop_codon:yes gene_type:complete